MHTALQLLAQTYNYSTNSSRSSSASGSSALVLVVIYLAVIVLLLVASAKLYQKAGRKWWEAIIPIYNVYVYLQIVGRPGWWLVLYFIPVVNIVVSVINTIDLAKVFGRGTGTGLLLLFFPFIMLPVMAFNPEYRYKDQQAGLITDTPYPSQTPPASSDTTGPTPPTHTEPTAPAGPQTPGTTPPTPPAS